MLILLTGFCSSEDLIMWLSHHNNLRSSYILIFLFLWNVLLRFAVSIRLHNHLEEVGAICTHWKSNFMFSEVYFLLNNEENIPKVWLKVKPFKISSFNGNTQNDELESRIAELNSCKTSVTMPFPVHHKEATERDSQNRRFLGLTSSKMKSEALWHT